MSNMKRRVSKLEGKIDTRKQLPMKERAFVAIENENGTAEEKLKKREKELIGRYGTLDGFNPILVRFTKP